MKITYLISHILLLTIFLFSQNNNELIVNEENIINEAVNAIDSLHNFKDFVITLEIYTLEKDNIVAKLTGTCLFKNFDESIILIDSPNKDKGKALLNKNTKFYIYFPSIRKTQIINPTSKLFGSFNTSDVLRPPFKENYEAKFLKQIDDTYVIEFIAKTKEMPYQKQLMYYDFIKKNVKYIEYYSKSDKLIKTAYYEEYIELESQLFITTIRIESVVGQTSVMKFKNYKKKVFPNNYFTPTGLRMVAESY